MEFRRKLEQEKQLEKNKNGDQKAVQERRKKKEDPKAR